MPLLFKTTESIYITIVRHWVKNGQHASNQVRLHVCQALKMQIKPAEIARYIRGRITNKNGQRFGGIGTNDKEY